MATLSPSQLRRREMQAMAPFDPEGSGYDYKTAIESGLTPGKDGHWPSRSPKSGQLLKGMKHKTADKMLKGEKKAGYEVYQGKDGRYYSRKKKEKD